MSSRFVRCGLLAVLGVRFRTVLCENAQWDCGFGTTAGQTGIAAKAPKSRRAKERALRYTRYACDPVGYNLSQWRMATGNAAISSKKTFSRV